ncbi:MAG TPA: SBBP repeat-containing protein [Syntrophales bacterium]|nr:SBBP repeat-containing protein [Syntrophales bacterium]
MKAQRIVLAVILLGLFAFAAPALAAQQWVKQFGTDQIDAARKVVTDSAGNVYVAGTTTGSFGEPIANKVGTYVFVAKFDSAGTLLWNVQFGSDKEDLVEGLSINDKAGFLYVAGSTEGAMPRGPDQGYDNASAGEADAFVAKISTANGRIRWVRQFGTPYDDHAYAAAPDGQGFVYVVGATKGAIEAGMMAPGDHYDAFITTLQDNGGSDYGFPNQFSIADGLNNHACDIAISKTDIFVAGLVQANPGGSLFITKFDTRLNGPSQSQILGGLNTESGSPKNVMALDKDSNVIVAGSALGSFDNHASAGSEDIIVAKFDKSLNKLWSSQYGTAGKDVAYGLAVDAEGNIYVAGETGSPGGPGLDGQSYMGASDMFLTRLASADGKRIYTRQLGTSGLDAAYGIAIDPSGAIYLAGSTAGKMGDQQFGNLDAVLIKYDKDGPIPVIDFYINGTVTELPYANPLPGVTITVKDGNGIEVTNTNGTTDALGHFNLKVPAAGKYSIYKLKIGYTAQVNPDVVDVTETAPTATPVCTMQKIVVNTSMIIRKGYSIIQFTKLPAGDRSVDAVFGKYAGPPYVEFIFSFERPMQYLLLLRSGKYGNLKTIEFGRHYDIYSQTGFTIDTTSWLGPDAPKPAPTWPGRAPW